ncbi:MAG TPA: hypothetical protein PK858_09745, partial [Saprospiraceae bacterium]|nr:hypothetical protein [Saprospiraceae bacterium]
MATWLRTALAALFLTLFGLSEAAAQQSIARRWNDLCLQAIREDLARPPVQARNLFHLSIAMYDAWAAYDTVAQPFMLGKTYSGYTTPFLGIARPADVEAARQEAISHAAYRLLFHRFRLSPNASQTIPRFIQLMDQLGYDPNFVSTDYSTGSPAALGNYIATAIISMGFQDGS